MQATSVRCPRCGNANTVPAAAVPTPVRCPICGSAYVVPPLSRHLPAHLPQPAEAPLPPTPPEDDDPREPPPDPQTGRRAALVWGGVILLLLSSCGLSVAIGAALFNRLFHAAGEVAEAIPTDPKRDPTIWTRADKPIDHDGIRVKITNVDFGKVLARNSQNEPVSAGPGEFLKVYLEIDNLGRGDLSYTSWHGNRFEEGGEICVADLGDAAGRVYKQQRFDGVQRLQGHTPQATLAVRESVEDVLIFVIPKAQVTSGQPLWLELPAGAFARTTASGLREFHGFFRFEIGADMLNGL